MTETFGKKLDKYQKSAPAEKGDKKVTKTIADAA